jgi:ArsR family transcriptional regulator, cadmium/lead-responsive transcriptional repressor
VNTVRNTVALSLKAKLFRGFSDPSRLSILEALKEQPLHVTDLVAATGMSVSNHLSCLRDCGLVSREQRGRFTYYRLADERLLQLLDITDGVLRDVARGVYECVNYNIPGDECCDDAENN